jgi:hypothetical protein
MVKIGRWEGSSSEKKYKSTPLGFRIHVSATRDREDGDAIIKVLVRDPEDPEVPDECPICYTAFTGLTIEAPYQIDNGNCQHIIGSICMTDHVAMGQPYSKGCPFCRQDLYDTLVPPDPHDRLVYLYELAEQVRNVPKPRTLLSPCPYLTLYWSLTSAWRALGDPSDWKSPPTAKFAMDLSRLSGHVCDVIDQITGFKAALFRRRWQAYCAKHEVSLRLLLRRAQGSPETLSGPEESDSSAGQVRT